MRTQHLRLVSALALSTGFALAAAPSAFAGECPANKIGVDVTKPGAMEPKAVTDVVLSALKLGDKFPEFNGRELRLRRLVVQPGGIVPWHEHPDRPANIYIVSGQITEYRSTCAVPIVHKAGEVAAEYGNLAHWWKNTGKQPATLISADLYRDGTKDDHM